MQTDVKSSYIDATGSVVGYPTRIKAVYIYAGASAGSLELTDGGSGGTSLFKVATPASSTNNPVYMLLPGEGIRFTSSVYATLSNIGAVTVIYG